MNFSTINTSFSPISKEFVVEKSLDGNSWVEVWGQKSGVKMSCKHLLAFTSGLTLTVNNFIVKATGTDFGEIMACRGLLQMPVMFGIITIEGIILCEKQDKIF